MKAIVQYSGGTVKRSKVHVRSSLVESLMYDYSNESHRRAAIPSTGTLCAVMGLNLFDGAQAIFNLHATS